MPKLFLIPNGINEEGSKPFAAHGINHVRLFFVEEVKSARRRLKEIDPDFPVRECTFYDLNEHTDQKELSGYIVHLKKQDGGIISEAGLPCVADPGADLVFMAHQNQIEVIPLEGPSSIFLALMASGLSGQKFAFNGYLPKEQDKRTQMIRMLEGRCLAEGQTQIFMETPYRNQNIFEDVIKECKPKTFLSVACDLTGANQWIKTQSIEQWRKSPAVLPKKPALFIIGNTPLLNTSFK